MGHHFDPDIAERYGIEEAILFENIYYWCSKNMANNQNFHDGHYWTYNSVKAFASMFKYMTEKKISSALKNLEDAGIIMSGCYNANPYDRTKWYAITDFGFSIYPKSKMENPIQSNEITPKGQMNVTDINQIINTDIKPDGEIKNMNPPPQEPSSVFSDAPSEQPSFSASSCIQQECLADIQSCHQQMYERWLEAKLPLSRSSAGSYFIFSCRELKSALGYWSGKGFTSQELLEALDNYIRLSELIRGGGSWMTGVGGFDQFAKHTMDYLDGNFILDNYRKGRSEQRQGSESIEDKTARLVMQWQAEEGN